MELACALRRTPEFLDWLNGVTRQRVVHCVRGDSRTAYLTQAIQSREFPVPLVAGEPALLRVFLTVKAGSANMPPVRATFYREGTIIHRAEIPGTSAPIPTQIDESSLSKVCECGNPRPGDPVRPRARDRAGSRWDARSGAGRGAAHPRRRPNGD